MVYRTGNTRESANGLRENGFLFSLQRLLSLALRTGLSRTGRLQMREAGIGNRLQARRSRRGSVSRGSDSVFGTDQEPSKPISARLNRVCYLLIPRSEFCTNSIRCRISGLSGI